MDLVNQLLDSALPKELAFPLEEYDMRVRKVRQAMARAGLDVLLLTSTSNICYLTGYETAMPSAYAIALLPLKGDIALQLSSWDLPTAVLTSSVQHLTVLDWYDLDKTAQLASLLRERQLHDKVIGIEARKASTYAIGAVDAAMYTALKALLPEAELRDATDIVLDVRLVKSHAEREYMRQAGEISFKGIRAAFDTIAPGKTDNDLVAAAYAALITAGSELMSIDPQIMTGYRSGCGPHAMYKRVPLKPGDAVYLECSASVRRYSAPIMRSATLGDGSAEIRRLADASIGVVELLLENIRAGRTAHDVAAAARKGLAGLDRRVYFHGSYSYSVGLSFPPYQSDTPMYIREGNEQVLEAGMTLHLPIYLFVPGQYGVGFSETIAVTERGCEVLTKSEHRRLLTCRA